MANVDAAFGLTPIRHLSGNGYSRANKYTIASGLAENIFTGDAVILIAGGTLTPHTATEVNNIGVFGGVSYTAADGSYVYSQYWPSGTVATNIIAYVYDDPYTVFKVQTAGTSAQADVGGCGDLVAGAGSTTTGQSAHELNGTTSTGTAGFRVLGKLPDPDNAYGTNVLLEVQPYEHELNMHIDADGTPGV